MRKALTLGLVALALSLLATPLATFTEKTAPGSVTHQTEGPESCVIIAGVLYCW